MISLPIIIFIIILVIYVGYLKYIKKEDSINILGYRQYMVMTGSMEPTLKVGGMAVINPRLEVQTGDIAMYKMGEGYIIHRVIRIEGDNYYFKGDNVQDEDSFNPIHKDELIGPVVIRINFVAPLFKKFMHINE